MPRTSFGFLCHRTECLETPSSTLHVKETTLKKGTLGPDIFLHVFDFFSGASCSAGPGHARAFDGLWHPKAEQIQSATSKTQGSVCFKVIETPMKKERKNPQDVTCFRSPAPHAVAPKPSMVCGIQKPSRYRPQLGKPKLG